MVAIIVFGPNACPRRPCFVVPNDGVPCAAMLSMYRHVRQVLGIEHASSSDVEIEDDGVHSDVKKEHRFRAGMKEKKVHPAPVGVAWT